jgi:hypothetical protein
MIIDILSIESIKVQWSLAHWGNGKGIRMRKHFKVFVYIFIFVFIFANSSFSSVKSVDKPKRIISIVYDDSNSMLENQKTTWSHARYSLQIFAALLEENDELNVFLMSSFLSGSNRSSPDITVSGSSPNRVSELLDGMTARNTGGTPYRAVQAAYEYLRKNAKSDDEKWLIVLTDGDFNDNPNLNEEYNKYISRLEGLKILTLAIGPDVDSKKLPATTNSILVYKANVDEEVTLEIANIAKRVFNRAELSNLRSFELGIPVSEIIVFAQGENVIVGLGNLSGATITKIIDVKVDNTDIRFATSNTKYVDNIRSANLRGKLVYISPTVGADFIDIQKNVTLDISGSNSIRIYYKPKVEIEVYLSTLDGKRVDDDRIHSGSYIIKANIVHPGDPSRTSEINQGLLGNLEFDFRIMNNDKYISCGVNACRLGSTIAIERGTLNIDVVGLYLTYNSISDSKSFKVLSPPQPVTLTISKKSEGYLLSNLEEEQPIQVEISQNGVIISKEKWDLLHIEDVHVTGGALEYIVKKSDAIGILYIYPKYKNGDPYLSQNKDFDLNIDVSFLYDEGINEGKITESIGIIDDLSAIERFIDFLRKHGMSLFFALIILFIIGSNIIKKRFSRTFRQGYMVTQIDKNKIVVGKYPLKIKVQNRFNPFSLAERTSLQIKYGTYTIPEVPVLHLVATKNGIKLINYKEFIELKDFDISVYIDRSKITEKKVIKGDVILTYAPTIKIVYNKITYECKHNI